MSAFLPDQTRLSQVRLRSARLQPVLEFYTGVLGLTVAGRRDGEASLASVAGGASWLVIAESQLAAPRPLRSTGLYHLAIRYPTRASLAGAVRRLLTSRYPLDGASDHSVSEAIYLTDPDGNGVELYADRPREQWAWHAGEVSMFTRSLDLDGLLDAAKQSAELATPPADTQLGHIHLNVADLAAAERFYRDYLGLALTQRSYPGALFFAAGGYHHHLGVNTWAGTNPAPADSVGLVSYRFEVPLKEVVYCLQHRAPLLGYETRFQPGATPSLQVRDLNGNWLEIEASNR